jgi:phosphatidylinositol-3-phosphatase
VWIIEENESQSGITAGSAPYMSALAARCGLTTDLQAITHPSLPNYIAMTSGLMPTFHDDDSPSSHHIASPSIFSQLGANWLALQEGMSSNCRQTSGGDYAVRHNPAAYYTTVRAACDAQDVPYSPTGAPNVSRAFTFITPNLCDDMHDCAVHTGDEWLGIVVPKILASPEYLAGDTAVIITFDEGDGAAQTVWTAVIAPSVIPGTVASGAYSHFSTLRTTEELLGLPLLGHAASAASYRSAFHLG